MLVGFDHCNSVDENYDICNFSRIIKINNNFKLELEVVM